MKKPFKLLSLSIAGCCLLASYTQVVLAANIQAVPASVPMNAVTGNVTAIPSEVKITSRSVKEKNDGLSVDLNIPVIAGMKDKKYEAQWNDIVSRHVMEDLEASKKMAKEDAEQEPEYFRPHELIVRYAVKTNSNGVLSLAVQTYTYTGGAHGGTRIDTYNIADKDEAARIELKDLFGASYKDIIDQHIKEEIAKEPDNYFPDAFEGITDTQSFYIENGQAVIVFGEYEIAPYAAGRPEFRIAIPAQAGAGGSGSASNDMKPSKLVVNGTELPHLTDKSGVILAPLRAVAESIGFELKWNADKQQAEVMKGAQWTAVTVGRDSYAYNKMAPVQLGAAPFINADGSVYVPVAFFSDILKAEVTTADGVMTIKQR